jgi:hypothetical protein
MQVTQFDLEHIQTVADGCPRHPAYRVTSSIPDFSECQGCAKVFAAYSMLCVAGLLDFQQMAKARAATKKQ